MQSLLPRLRSLFQPPESLAQSTLSLKPQLLLSPVLAARLHLPIPMSLPGSRRLVQLSFGFGANCIAKVQGRATSASSRTSDEAWGRFAVESP